MQSLFMCSPRFSSDFMKCLVVQVFQNSSFEFLYRYDGIFLKNFN